MTRKKSRAAAKAKGTETVLRKYPELVAQVESIERHVAEGDRDDVDVDVLADAYVLLRQVRELPHPGVRSHLTRRVRRCYGLLRQRYFAAADIPLAAQPQAPDESLPPPKPRAQPPRHFVHVVNGGLPGLGHRH